MQCIGNHKSHDVLKLTDKYKLLRKNLKYFRRNSSKSISKLLEVKREVVICSKDVKERFRLQYQIIQQRLLESYQQHITQIENEMQKELSRLDNTQKELENGRLDIKKQLRDTSHSDNLIQQCGHMIALEKRLALELYWKKPTYVETSNESFSKELLEFSKHLGQCKFETISELVSPAPRECLISTPILSPRRQKSITTEPKIDSAREKSFTEHVAQTDQLSNKVFNIFITE